MLNMLPSASAKRLSKASDIALDEIETMEVYPDGTSTVITCDENGTECYWHLSIRQTLKMKQRIVMSARLAC